jgi:hypothetical protein
VGLGGWGLIHSVSQSLVDAASALIVCVRERASERVSE